MVWEEYRQAHPEGYGYSRFCELYQRWRGKQDVVLRQEHPPGKNFHRLGRREYSGVRCGDRRGLARVAVRDGAADLEEIAGRGSALAQK
jgi:hypothetical protein